MIIFIEGCLCFSDTKRSSIATAVFTLITRLLMLLIFSILLSQGIGIVFIKSTEHLTISLNLTIATLTDCCILIVFSLLLIFGVKKNKKQFVLPWIIFMPMEIVCCIISSIVLIAMVISEVTGTNVSVMYIVAFGLILWGSFNLYLFLSVMSHYQVMAGIIALRYPIYVKDFTYDAI